MKRNKYTGCDEDCFNCPYSDCRKPAGKMDLKSPLERVDKINNQKTAGTVYANIFTLELGKTGRNTPNISRKFYL